MNDPEAYLNGPGVVTKHVAGQPFLRCRTTLTPATAMDISMTVVAGATAALDRSVLSHYASVMHGDGFDDAAMDAEVGYLLLDPGEHHLELTDEITLTERLLPAEEMATVVVTGGPTRYPAGFTTIGLWAEANRVRLGGPHREIFLEMPVDNDDTAMVIELQIPILEDDELRS